MKKATITYLLSQEGRKKSILAGGDGQEVQTIEADITPELLEIAYVDRAGNVKLDLTEQKVVDIELENMDSERWTWHNKPGLVAHKAHAGNIYDGKKYFDAPQTAEALVAWEKNRIDHIAAKKAELQPELDRLLADYEAKMAAKKAEEEAEKEAREAERAEREAAAQAEKEAREAEKAAWIEAHGSDYLKDAHALGYNCQRQYVTERAALEFPEFEVDFDNRCNWKERACPSPEALAEVKALVAAGHDAQVVWLTDDGADREDWEEFEPCEAVVIRNYLGKYDLVKF
jgi:hypothetical protein